MIDRSKNPKATRFSTSDEVTWPRVKSGDFLLAINVALNAIYFPVNAVMVYRLDDFWSLQKSISNAGGTVCVCVL